MSVSLQTRIGYAPGSDHQVCSGVTVGVLVIRREHLAMLLRAKAPLGWAPPMGHCEPGEDPVLAARRELEEETGLIWKSGGLLLRREQMPTLCNRGATHHDILVYIANAEGELSCMEGDSESYSKRWMDSAELHQQSLRAFRYESGAISESAWRQDPGLNPVWRDLFGELDYL